MLFRTLLSITALTFFLHSISGQSLKVNQERLEASIFELAKYGMDKYSQLQDVQK